jgi:hypothetical protein
VLAIAEDHVNPKILFAGTEFGLFFTIDGGEKWIQLKSGLPTIAVRDIAIQKRENDVVLATFGRGFYILDNYSPLRELTPDLLKKEAHVFDVKNPLMFIQAQPLGGTKKSFQGESYYTASNPQFGAVITYYLKETYKSKKEKRQEAEKEAEKRKEQVKYPSWNDLRAEDDEEAPAIIVTISDADGNVVRKLSGSMSKGINRVAWDLRYPLPVLSSPPEGDDDPDAGALVMPGTYSVTIAKRVDGIVMQLGEKETFEAVVLGNSSMTGPNKKTLAEFQQKVSRLQRAVSGSLQTANEIKSRIGTIKRALMETQVPADSLLRAALSVESAINGILRNLRGDATLRSRNENSPVSINERVNRIGDDLRLSTSLPTQTHRDAYTIAGSDFKAELSKLRTLVEAELSSLEKKMEAAYAPWTPGRIPTWNEE